jgi:hypothetical protein
VKGDAARFPRYLGASTHGQNISHPGANSSPPLTLLSGVGT